MVAVAVEETKSSPWTPPLIAYGVFLLACIAAFYSTVSGMLSAWTYSSTYHHGFLVAPAVLFMIAARPAPATLGGGALLGYAFVAAGAALWLAGHAAGALILEEFALITVLIGGAGVAFGAHALKHWAYPLAFLYFMVPFGDAIVPALQTVTAKSVVWLLSTVGVPVAIEGYLIRTPAGLFEIAEACAGLRFLLAALMVAAFCANMLFATWRKRILFLLFAAALAIAANGVRAFMMVLIATLTDKQWAVGPDHQLMGWALYAFMFFVLISMGRRFADNCSEEKPQTEPLLQNAKMTVMAPAFAILIAMTIYSASVIDRPIRRDAPASLSLFNAPGWRILPPPANWSASLPFADRAAGATYANDNAQVYVAIGYVTHDRKGAEIVNAKNRAHDGGDWRLAGRADEVVYLFGESQKQPFELIAGPERRRLAVLTAYWLDDKIYLEPNRLKLAQMKARLKGVNPSGGVIMIAASYTRDPIEAVHAIRAFTSDVEPFGGWLQRNHGM